MPKVEIEMDGETAETIQRIWRENRRRMSEEVLRQLGWDRLETFAGDLLCLGFEVAAEDPRKFILHMRERKAPIFREPEEALAERRRREDESLRGYA
jgi:hypothetical protein